MAVLLEAVGKLQSITVETGRTQDGVFKLSGRDAAQQLIVTGHYDSGQVRDLTRSSTFTVAPAGMSIDPSTGLVSWTPTMSDIGTHTVRVVAVDPNGLEASQQYPLQIVPETVNRPPIITSTPETMVADGATYEYQLQVIDPDGDALVFAITDGPEGPTERVLDRGDARHAHDLLERPDHV